MTPPLDPLRTHPLLIALAARQAQELFDAEAAHANQHGTGDHWAYRGGWAKRTNLSQDWAHDAHLDRLCALADVGSIALVIAEICTHTKVAPYSTTATKSPLYWLLTDDPMRSGDEIRVGVMVAYNGLCYRYNEWELAPEGAPPLTDLEALRAALIDLLPPVVPA